MALPMALHAKKLWPELELSWMVGKGAASIVKELAYTKHCIDKVIEVDETAILKGNIPSKVLALAKAYLELHLHYDWIATCHSDPRYRLLSLPCYAKKRFHFSPSRGQHHSLEYLRMIDKAAGEAEQVTTKLIFSKSLPQRFEGWHKGKKAILLAPGGAKNLLRNDEQRRWPLHYYVTLAEKLVQAGFSVGITGGKDDKLLGSAFPKAVTNFIDQTSLLELIALYQSAQLIVTHDSGPLHLAGLAGTAIIALFGPTEAKEKLPYTHPDNIALFLEELACRPCYDGKNYAVCDNYLCMKGISVEKVFATIQHRVNKHKSELLRPVCKQETLSYSPQKL